MRASPSTHRPPAISAATEAAPPRPRVDSAGSSSETLHGDNVGNAESVQTIVTFAPDDPAFPPNWSRSKKLFVVAAGILSVINSTLGSSLPANAIEYISDTFNVTNELQLVLPISTYLMGYVVGPVLCGPASEHFGRKPVILSTFFLYTVWTMSCAVASSWWSFLLFRFLSGVSASSPIAVVGGLYADVYNNPRSRGMAMAFFMASTTLGPVFGPFISGIISENTTWRWVFGFGTLLAVATMPLLVFLPETYAPVLLRRRAARIRQESGKDVIAKSDQETKTFRYIMTVVMTRPYRMLFQELIVACVCAYLSLAYAIFYLYFEAYPLIFQGPDSVYGWSPGIAGLAFLPIGVGALLCAPIFCWWDARLARARKNHDAWVQKEEYRRLPLACVGGPLYVVSLFWIGWSARADVHWIVPILSGVTFGIGFLLIFMALLNYLTDAYEIYSASAMGISSTCRSIFGALLPLAAHRMFTTLGIAWACSLLAFLSLGMAIIPFVFIRYGDVIRARSKFCQELRAMKEQDRDAAEAQRSSHASNNDSIDEKV